MNVAVFKSFELSKRVDVVCYKCNKGFTKGTIMALVGENNKLVGFVAENITCCEQTVVVPMFFDNIAAMREYLLPFAKKGVHDLFIISTQTPGFEELLKTCGVPILEAQNMFKESHPKRESLN